MPELRRIEVTDGGLTLTTGTAPLMSAFGAEMRPGATSVHDLPWDEISGILLAPAGLTVDVVWGEYVEVHPDADGFAEAVRALCRLFAVPVPAAEDTVTIRPGR